MSEPRGALIACATPGASMAPGDVPGWRGRWSRLIAAAEGADASAIASADARTDGWPGWVRLADPGWVLAIDDRQVERFDRSSMDIYTTTIRTARGLREAPDPRAALARALDLNWIEGIAPALIRDLAPREDLLGALGALTILPAQIDAPALAALGARSAWRRLEIQGRRAVDRRQGGGLAREIAGGFSGLRALSVHAQALGDEGAAALAGAGFAGALDELSLMVNGIGDAGAAALGGALTAPRRVNLRDNEIGAAGARGLAPALRGVERLDLSENPIGDEGLIGLIEGGALETVSDLWISRIGISDRGLRALIAADLPALRGLWVDGNALTDDGAAALIHSPLMGRLLGLSLYYGRDVGARIRAALEGHPLAGALRGTARIDDWGVTLVSRWP